jgi:hypothetical protein
MGVVVLGLPRDRSPERFEIVSKLFFDIGELFSFRLSLYTVGRNFHPGCAPAARCRLFGDHAPAALAVRILVVVCDPFSASAARRLQSVSFLLTLQ